MKTFRDAFSVFVKQGRTDDPSEKGRCVDQIQESMDRYREVIDEISSDEEVAALCVVMLTCIHTKDDLLNTLLTLFTNGVLCGLEMNASPLEVTVTEQP